MNIINNKDIRGAFFRRYRDTRRYILGTCSTAFAYIYAKLLGVQIGKDVRFFGSITFDRNPQSQIVIGHNCCFISSPLLNRLCNYPSVLNTTSPYGYISIGDNCGFSSVHIRADIGVKIGNRVMVGANTIIYDTDAHPELTGNKPKPIIIEDDVFIGMDCHILKGVTIGKGSIIGAGSIVTKDIPAGVIAAGVPCKVVRCK